MTTEVWNLPRAELEEEALNSIRSELDSAALPRPQSYRLSVTGDGARVLGADPAGLYYGAATLRQWLRLSRASGEGVPGLEVEDWPAIPHRGVLLDVSRNRVPRMDFLYELVDQLAGWKINQLQLYFEHTFAYRGHEIVWQDASPFTAEEIRRLDAFCAQRAIELVPNQNSFGHFHRWLKHPPYRHLAECPEGIRHAFSAISAGPEPFSLCPTEPGSIDLLGDLYDQLLPNFTSSLFNVGLDETFDLGQGRSQTACEERGKEEVYVEFLRQVHTLAADRGRRIQFWGDIIVKRPDLLSSLPRDAIALEWGYDAGHPFDEHLRRFAESGLDFYACPGTSSWNSFAGRADNALLNLSEAARSAAGAGALGYLITDWGDSGHLQPPAVSTLGCLAGAGFSWNPATSERPLDIDFATLLDVHAFQCDGLGRIAIELGNAYQHTGATMHNGSALFFLLNFAEQSIEQERFAELDAERLADLSGQLSALQAELSASSTPLLRREFAWVAHALELGVELGVARLREPRVSLPHLKTDSRRHLAQLAMQVVDTFRPLWLERSRPGGLEDSAARLQRVVDLLS